MDQVNSLEDELRTFGKYKVPPHFFGLGIQQVDYITLDGIGAYTENIDDVEFKLHLPNKTYQTIKEQQVYQS